MKSSFFYFVFALILLNSCSISNVKFNGVEPAEINIPNHINNVIIIDRTAPSKNNTAENILDGLLSGESIGLDKDAGNVCVKTLKSLLNNSPRFSLISTDAISLKGTGTADFPNPLKWKKIQKITENYNADALIILELFDSSSSIRDLGTRKQKIKKDGEWIEVFNHVVSLDVEIQAGWRIYDVNNKKIVDEKRFFDQKHFEKTDKSVALAKKKLPSKRSAILEAASFSGEQFYYRISPHYIIINREYYKNLKNIKGYKIKRENTNTLFLLASKKVISNNWQGAAEIWKQFVNHTNPEVSGRSCYNMALASEATGNINLAIDWIKKAIKFGNQKASVYLMILKNRKSDFEKLENQLK